MTVTLVGDPSEATELCASQQLYLKPVAKLTISVSLPEHSGSTRAFSKWEVMDKLKNMICPDQFTSVKVSKSTKGFIRFEGEAETKRLVCSLKEKLHGKMIKLNGFKDDLQVVATEAPAELPAPQASELSAKGRKRPEDEQSPALPDCLHLEGLPCKWFALRGSDSEMPNEEVLRAVFGSFGKIKNVDIPMLDPYREETVGGSANSFIFRGMRTFEAFLQYHEPQSFAKAMETLKGMKLMFKGDDGKALACNIKVASDTTSHFSESAIKQRNLERLTLQGLERERKREENRGRKGTERKRREDDDRKVGEGKRKSKIKRREKRQIDRDEKRPRKQPKVTAGDVWPEEMPEWEERKYLLAQRRVESIRLLTVLLSQIKNFVLLSEQTEVPPLDPENERGDSFSVPLVEDGAKEEEEESSPYLGHGGQADEGQPACQPALSDNTHVGDREEEWDVVTDLPPSLSPLVRTVLNEPALRAVTSRLGEDVRDCSETCGLLQVTVTQEPKAIESPGSWGYPRANLGGFAGTSHAGSHKKQKVYETEEFIHYLLNYYQTPRYARICPGTQSPTEASWWQRVVSCSGGGFRVSLKNQEEECLSEGSFISDLLENECRTGDHDYQWEPIDMESDPAEIVPENQASARELSKSYQVAWEDSLDGASDGSPTDRLHSPPLGCNTPTRSTASREETPGATAALSLKSSGHMSKLKDLLEEISSDSECFSEAFNELRNPAERRNGSSCKAWPLQQPKAKELLICVQNVACGDSDDGCRKRSFSSGPEGRGSSPHHGQRPKARSRSKCRHEQNARWPSSEEERNASRKKKKKKKKKTCSGNSLLDDEHQFLNMNHHCRELDSLSKVPRKYSKMFHPKLKCKTLESMGGAVKMEDIIHFGSPPLPAALQEAGKGSLDLGKRRHKMEERQRLCKGLVER